MSSSSSSSSAATFVASITRQDDSAPERRTRERAIGICLDAAAAADAAADAPSVQEHLLMACVAATIHARHLWSLLQRPPIGPAQTPWAIQWAVKAVRSAVAKQQQQRDGNSESDHAAAHTQQIDDRYLEFRLSHLRAQFRGELPVSSAPPPSPASFQAFLLQHGEHFLEQSRPVAPPTALPAQQGASPASGDAAAAAAASDSAAAAMLARPSATFSPHIRVCGDDAGDGVGGRVVFAAAAAAKSDGGPHQQQQLLLPRATTLFRVPASLLFNARTVAQHSKLGRVLTSATAPWRDALDASGEALLLLTLLYELVRVGPLRSHWSDLLRSCPKHFPHVPICWPEDDLMFLDPAMFETVAEKGAGVERFVEQSRALLRQIGLAHCRAGDANDREGGGDDDEPSFRSLEEIVNAKSVTWARCVFDSRSFVLMYPDGSELTTLAPCVDMLNHDAYSDVLNRKIDPETGDFVMISGPAIYTSSSNSSSPAQQEVFLSYGPCETWELLTSYGFVPHGAESGANPYDSLLLPLAYGDDDDDDEDAENDKSDDADRSSSSSSLVRAAIDAACLGALSANGLFIPVQGQIPVAVRHIVAIWYSGDAAELQRLSAPGGGGITTHAALDELLTEATKQSVAGAIRQGLELYLSSSPHTIEEDEAMLAATGADSLTANARAAVVARLSLKNIARRALQHL